MVLFNHGAPAPEPAAADPEPLAEAEPNEAAEAEPNEAAEAEPAMAAPSEPETTTPETPASIDSGSPDEPPRAATDPGLAPTLSLPPPRDVELVKAALSAEGFEVASCNLDDDIDRLGHAVVVRRPDVAVNLVHQLWGDATQHVGVTRLCDLYGYPCIGSDPLALATCQERTRVRLILADAGVPGPGFVIVRSRIQLPDTEHLRFPVIITQAFDDTYHLEGFDHSLESREDIEARLAHLCEEYDYPFLIEELLTGRRLHVIVTGNRNLDTLPIVESTAGTDPGHELPLADLDDELARATREAAKAAFRALACSDVAQIDICLHSDGSPRVIDVRPAFEMGPSSPFRSAALASDGGFNVVLRELVLLTLKRAGIATNTAPEA